MTKYIFVMVGGAFGALARFAIGTLVQRLSSVVFPIGTCFVNVTGSFLIGLLMMFFLNRPAIGVNWRLFWVIGIVGGYTTFSTFEWETLVDFRGGASFSALLNVLLSVAWAWRESGLEQRSRIESGLVDKEEAGRTLIYSAMTDQTWMKSD